MAGTKRRPRKKTSNKGKDSSPREGDKQKQRRQNSGQKEVLSKGQQLSPAVTRNSKKTSTQVVVAATTTITPKQLDHTFQSFDPDKDQETKQDDTNIEGSDAEDSKEENTTAPKTLFARPTIPMHTKIHPLHLFTRSTYTLQTTTKPFIPATRILPAMRTKTEKPIPSKHQEMTTIAVTPLRNPTNKILTPFSLQANTLNIRPSQKNVCQKTSAQANGSD
jgi:hypothetical protein